LYLNVATEPEDDESDCDSNKGDDDSDVDDSIPEHIDKDSLDLEHTMDVADHLPALRATEEDEGQDLLIAQDFTKLAPLRTAPQQNTLETILDGFAGMNSGIRPRFPSSDNFLNGIQDSNNLSEMLEPH